MDKNWLQINVRYAKDHDLESSETKKLAMDLACAIADRWKCHLYYACYTYRDNSQVITASGFYNRQSRQQLQDIVSGSPGVSRVKCKPVVGSMQHALMFQVARSLRNEADGIIMERIHWMMNMLGKSYGQELLWYQSAAFNWASKLVADSAVYRKKQAI